MDRGIHMGVRVDQGGEMLNLFAPMNHLGMGIHSYHLAKAYEAMGHEIALIPPFGNLGFSDQWIERWRQNAIHFFAPHNPGLMIFDIAFMAQFCGSPRIGMAVFETDGLTPLQVTKLRSLDRVLTPSSWGQKVLANHGIASDIVPEGFDPEVFSYQPRSLADCGNGPVTFAHVGKFEERKGTVQVMRCFAEALAREEATLLMHIHNPFVTDYGPVDRELSRLNFATADGQSFRRFGLKIEFSHPQEESVPGVLFRRADCGIFPTKGEGWGLPILECIASGTPAIVGRWTAMADYIPTFYPQEIILSTNDMATANDGQWFHGDRGSWYLTDDEQLIRKIKWAFANIRKLRASHEWSWAANHALRFTWANAARELEDAIGLKVE